MGAVLRCLECPSVGGDTVWANMGRAYEDLPGHIKDSVDDLYARHSIEAIFAELEPQGVFARMVRVDHPFHHTMMQPASEALENALADLTPRFELLIADPGRGDLELQGQDD